MKKFLEYVAEDILNKYGTNLAHTAIVFPNKRASIFLNTYLSRLVGKPLWSPAYITISDLFRQNSQLTVGDPIKLVCEAHKTFTACTGLDETLDHFYGWGQLMLSDFDDIDKNMADASNVLRNIRDLHELDDISYLTEEQRAVLRRFFSNFTDDSESVLKQRFIRLWSHFEDIYNGLRLRLEQQQLAYEGMLYRKVVEQGSISTDYERYLFVGFNMLQKVEQKLFAMFKDQDKARFYWDFDHYYMPGKHARNISNEAGHYVAEYLDRFPNELDSSNTDIYDNLNKEKKVTFASAATENIQARYISSWLKDCGCDKDGSMKAVVLCDETLLPAAIHCFPDNIGSVNITTGFPLLQTAIASLVANLVELRNYGYSPSNDCFRQSYVLKVLSHPYAKYISSQCAELAERLKSAHIYYPKTAQLTIDESTKTLFSISIDNEGTTRWILDILKIIAANSEKVEKDPLFQESLFRMYTLCNRLHELIACGDLNVDMITLQRLLTQIISSTNVPFHGEPVEDIQLMGVLETRNLDFEHLLILSCNEGKMPKGINDSSFIPYSIRKAYGLTTIDNKVAIYAYYFYNLLQRASDITIVYNSSTEGTHTGEMSRFMLQLMVESNYDIKRISLNAGQEPTFRSPHDVPKDDSIMKVMDAITMMSPTAINRYMRCPLQFYFNDVAKIKDQDDEDEGMSNRIFGNIFHEVAEQIYTKLIDTDRVITASMIENLLKNKELIMRTVDAAFSKIVFNQPESSDMKHRYNGLQLINREVIIRYVMRLLELDRSITPFRVKSVETDVRQQLSVTTSAGQRKLYVGGRIDRLDQITDTERNTERIRIIDYKTGGSMKQAISNADDIFKRPVDTKKHADYVLQTMLYSIIVKNDNQLNSQKLPVSPALLFIQHTKEDNYDPTISIGRDKVYDVTEYEHDFCDNIRRIIAEIFEPEVPFSPTTDTTVCEYCPYKGMCGV